MTPRADIVGKVRTAPVELTSISRYLGSSAAGWRQARMSGPGSHWKAPQHMRSDTAGPAHLFLLQQLDPMQSGTGREFANNLKSSMENENTCRLLPT